MVCWLRVGSQREHREFSDAMPFRLYLTRHLCRALSLVAGNLGSTSSLPAPLGLQGISRNSR